MTEIAKTTGQAPAPQNKNPLKAGGVLEAFVPQDSAQLFSLAKALSESGDMIPKHFQNRPNEIVAAIMTGMELKIPPMQALKNIAVINGRATVWGDLLPALMFREGHHIDVEIEGEGDDACAVATLTRGDTGKTVVRRFSMADARRAKLAEKPGPWQQYPTRMLMHRARSWAVRDGAPDALMGMQVAEEVDDYRGPDNARDVTPRRRGGGYTLAAPSPAPAHNDAPEAHSAPQDVDDIIEGEPEADAPPALPEELDSAYDAIIAKLSEAKSPLDVAKTLDAFAPQVDAIRAASPAHGDEIDRAAEMARAA